MTDLYAHLNIPRNADAATIRRAYRKRAKSDHPDAPTGSREQFELTSKALAILTDPTRRARYDATGDMSEVTPDNEHAEIAQIIVQLFDAVCAEEARRGSDPIHLDVLKYMRELCNKNLTLTRQNRAQAEANLKSAERMLGRFKRKAKAKPGDNLLDRLMQGRTEPFKHMISQLDTKISRFEKVAEVLKDYSFDFDAPAPRASTIYFTNNISTSAS